MKAPQTEITDKLQPKQFSGSVSGVGAIIEVTDTKQITGGFVWNPLVGPYQNEITKYLKVSVDGQNDWVSIPYGGRFCFRTNPINNKIYIDAGVSGGVGYEGAMAFEDHSAV